MSRNEFVPALGDVEAVIRFVRGHKVILDADLARFYGVSTKRLNEQVKRNPDRFPEDFVFRLTREETEQVNRSQNATGSQRHRDPRFPPYAFTEHGALALAGVLKSDQAARVSVFIVRAFVRLRQLLAANQELAAKLNELDTRVGKHDRVIRDLVSAIRELMRGQVAIKAKLARRSAPAPRRRIGFGGDGE